MRKCGYFLLLFFLSSPLLAAPPACKCHSKNPPLRRMHEMLGFNGCGDCHPKGENLMQAKSAQEEQKKKAQMKKRFQAEQACFPCHQVDGAIKKEIYLKAPRMKITDSLYCPQDKAQFPLGTKACPKCGGNLIDINALMAESRKNPSNDICQKCHLVAQMTVLPAHQKIASAELSRCLKCHQGHDDCKSCHH